MSDKIFVKMTLDGGKTIDLELYPKIAPISANNFAKLCREGFYDGTVFHRVVPDFVIQGGDPSGTGTGGPGYQIKGEFKANGVENNIKHVRGVLSMARSAPFDSAGSQFFIMHDDAPHLDGQYAAFGAVTNGMDVVDGVVADFFAGKKTAITSTEVTEA